MARRAQHQIVGVEAFRPLAPDALDLGLPQLGSIAPTTLSAISSCKANMSPISRS
jgi:hypothetical protein